MTQKEPNVVYCHNCHHSQRADLFFKKYFPSVYDSIANTIYESFKNNFVEEIPQQDDSIEKSLNSSIEFGDLVNFLKSSCASFKNVTFLNDKESAAREYLIKRMVPVVIVDKCYYCGNPQEYADEKFQDYIIIPYYNEFDIPYYFQARYVGDDQNALRFMTSDFECCPKTAIFNEKIVDNDDTIFVVEGIIDSMNIENSISITGTGISDEVIEYISDKFKDVIWLNDNDEAGKVLTERLLKMDKKCFVWPKGIDVKDINDFAIRMKRKLIDKDWLVKNSFSGIRGLGKLL